MHGDDAAERARLAAELAALRRRLGPYEPGHFHSPIPDLAEVGRDAEQLFAPGVRELPGVDRNEAQQWRRLAQLATFAGQEHFPRHATPDVARYYWDNQAFPYGDAFALYAMLRLLQPRRVIEIGSGYSSAVMLDTLERHPELATQLLFV